MQHLDTEILDVAKLDRRLRAGLVRALFLAACGFLLISCDGSAPTGPDAAGNSPPAPVLPPGSNPDAAGLDSALAAERARIALRVATSQPEYTALRLLWLEIELNPILLPLSPLLQCEPLQYAGDAQVVGPEGSQLRVGSHVVRIPAGAVRTPAVITAESDPSMAIGVKFLPEGLTFDRPLEVELDYQHCDGILTIFMPPLRGAYVDDQGTVLEYPQATDDRGNRRITIFVDHFSKYAVAY